jgi:DNA-binding transcriptional MerR regulator
MDDAMMTIGTFARSTGLSAKALRNYDELGLLRPASVDPDTGYRSYSAQQLARGRTIRKLRELDVPLLEIGALLDGSRDELRTRLLDHQRRLAFRSAELHHALARLQRLIEGKEDLMDDLTVDAVDEATHRRLAVDLFNRSWRLLELSGRTAEQDDELIHVVHASCHHWREVGTAANLSRGENQCARVYAALGRGEPALHHAGRCLELVRSNAESHEEWELASALEVLARAHLTSGSRAEAERCAALAREELSAVEDLDDREIVAGQLAELDVLVNARSGSA